MSDQYSIQPIALYPTHTSLQEAFERFDAQLPISTRNELKAVLGTYHNTLLREINEASTHTR